jgi:tetratricopeptide (TPR) repeat protein
MAKPLIFLTMASAIAVAGAARAADKPVIAPPAAWVKPAQVDLAPPKAAKDAPVAFILRDLQTRVTPDGEAIYREVIAKAQTPQGLTPLGAVSPAWNPDTDILTVHKIHIIRDGKVIDVLASGKTFTILRRENKLEQATLDGTLTAVMQLEGLEVGDILDVAFTLEHDDPVLKGWIQQDIFMNGPPVSHLRTRVIWPTAVKLRLLGSDWAPPMRMTAGGGLSEASLVMDDAPETVLPRGAPARFQRGREIEASSFQSWSDVSALMAPLFDKAARLDPGSPLQAEVKRIAALSTDPKVRTEAALTLVEDQVRYVLLALDGGGLKPAPADLTWSRRFGDCKGKTALLLALLKALGVDAEPVLANSVAGDGLDQRLPSLLAFDHVLVHTKLGGKDYWIDGTRTGDRSLDAIRTPPFKWVLPLRAQGATLVALTREPLATPDSSVAMRLDASAGIGKPAPAHVDIVFRGDAATMLNLSLAPLTGEQIDQALRTFWSRRYTYIEPKTVSAKFDRATGEETFQMDGVATLDWSGKGLETTASHLVAKPDLERRPGPHDDAPFAVNYPAYEVSRETVILPGGGKNFSVFGVNVDETVGSTAFIRKAAIVDGVFTVDVSQRSLAPEFPFSQAEQVKTRLTELSESGLFLVPHAGASAGHAPMSAQALSVGILMAQGRNQRAAGEHDQALATFDKALALDPKSAQALGWRAVAEADVGENAKAAADADAAIAIDPNESSAYTAKGAVARRAGRPFEAIALLTRAAELDPHAIAPRLERPQVYLQAGAVAAALIDADGALAAFPGQLPIMGVKAAALARLGRMTEVVDLAHQMQATSPADAWAWLDAAQALKLAGRKTEALASADKAVALHPSVAAYLIRAYLLDPDDSRVLDDANAALKLDPKSRDAKLLLAQADSRQGKFTDAKAVLDPLVLADPKDAQAVAVRGGVELKMGAAAPAASDFAQVRRMGSAEALNEICWDAATVAQALGQALADCDAAIKLEPRNAEILDSRAFVLLRLKRDDEAVAGYGAALALQPDLAQSLYGRSLAERRTGHPVDADRDVKAALTADPKVADEFKGYGVTQ